MDSQEFITYILNLKYCKYSTVCNNLLNYIVVQGKGDYGTAFKLKDGRVVKVFKAHDKAYLTFLGMISLSDNPHLPHIVCYDIYHKFGWVILEFLDEYSLTQYVNLSLTDICKNMTLIIKQKQAEKPLPLSLTELALEMRTSAQGFCLDFRKENFALRGSELVIFDPFTLKTKWNDHLEFVDRQILSALAKK